jgi:sterol desaturase/sphingolipid hydroxylase (fatty acid hydroxylase superfamily)
MINISDYLSFTLDELRTLIIITTFMVLFTIESKCSYRKNTIQDTKKSYRTNLGLFIFNDVACSLLSLSALWEITLKYSHIGLLAVLPKYLQYSISIIILDFFQYWWHRLCHNTDLLWMFHQVHHSDKSINVSTAFRLHIIEVLLTFVVKTTIVLSFGIPLEIILISEAVSVVFVMFHHANISFKGESLLGKLTIVPYLHRVHHSTVRAEHDTNYGAIFSIWDRLFGSFAETEPKQIGLVYSGDENLLALLKFGLSRSWQPLPTEVQSMVAEAAYYKAEKRGFTPGYEWKDWLDAEREILSQY